MANIILGSVPESIQSICGTQGIFHIRWKKKDKRRYIIKKYSDEFSLYERTTGKHMALFTELA